MLDIDNIVHSFVIWMESIISPVQSVNTLTNRLAEGGSVKAIFNYWLPPVVIGTIVQIPIAHMFGIDWHNLAYLALTIAFVLAGTCCSGIVIHIIMRVFGLHSNLVYTLGLYTITIIYYPITSVITLLDTYRTFNAIYEMKHKGVEGETIGKAFGQLEALLQKMPPMEASLNVVNIVAGYASAFISLLCFAALAEILSQWYQNPRYKTYIAVGTGSILTIVVQILVYVPLETVTMYSFVGSDK